MEFESGKIITGSFTIERITFRDHVVEIELNDGTTKIIGLLKDNIDLFSKTYSVGEKIICKGRVRKRRKYFCLDIIYLSKHMLDTQIDKKFDVQKYIDRFYELIASVTDVDYKKVLDNCFNEDVKELYFEYPAAQGNHHNYIHGLVQHSIEVVDISLLIGQYFSDVDRELLITAGLLHDIGKLKAYDLDDEGKISKTNWEALLGHLSISALFVSKIAPNDVDQTKIMLLYHLILSHHGELNCGSPIVCKTKESYILHRADEISSTLNHLDLLKYTNGWSEKDNTSFSRTWFKNL
jgi:23S rRNA maturation-related 3'-5' exoribonuclease YhaM